jgi:ferrous iron transport protein B
VTVGAKTTHVERYGYRINLSDLPGTYSITEYSPEELFVRKHLAEQMPDVVVNVVDASNLERNLLLTTQLIDMHLKVVVALNMYDSLEKEETKLDHNMLGKLLGIPMVPTVASKDRGIDDLIRRVIEAYEETDPTLRHIHINYGSELEDCISAIQDEVRQNKDLVARYASRYLAIKLLEGDVVIKEEIQNCDNASEMSIVAEREQNRLERIFGESAESLITNARFAFITGAMSETYTKGNIAKHKKGYQADAILTHRFWGFPIFLLLMWAMFQLTFTLGQYPADWIDAGFVALGKWVEGIMSDGPFKDLLVEGIIAGVGGVMVFMPNILILFLFIAIMEDTGYMARTAFIMDRIMHRIGLHGKSFLPLIMGFGCNVPAIMATRTLESRKDRLLTMLIMPFMSCSARLPVYLLLITVFFEHNQGVILSSLYLIGGVIAIISAIVLKKLFFKKDEVAFVMELPPYRIPTARSVMRHMWSRAGQYLKKMGTVILVASVIIWAMSNYPQNCELKDTYIGKLGQVIEPVLEPLGFDWEIGVSLLSGLAAKEIVISTMAVLNGSGENEDSLIAALQNNVNYTPLTAYCLMLFILLYLPCIAAIATVRREAGVKWAVFTALYTTGIAWLVTFIVWQIGQNFI